MSAVTLDISDFFNLSESPDTYDFMDYRYLYAPVTAVELRELVEELTH